MESFDINLTIRENLIIEKALEMLPHCKISFKAFLKKYIDVLSLKWLQQQHFIT